MAWRDEVGCCWRRFAGTDEERHGPMGLQKAVAADRRGAGHKRRGRAGQRGRPKGGGALSDA